MPFEYVLDPSCPVLEQPAVRRNLNIQLYYGINDEIPQCGKNTLATLRIYILKYLGGSPDIHNLLSNGSAKKACVEKGGGKERGRGMDRQGKGKRQIWQRL